MQNNVILPSGSSAGRSFDPLRLPDFLIVGAARCGTTWLYECLRQHPGIHLPENKRPEPHFFLKSDEYAQGIDYYSRNYFAGAATSQLAGEASTSYLYQPWVVERMRAALPEVKLIAAIRNPIDRAFSNYRITRANELETLSFSEAIRCEKDRLAEPGSRFEREVAPFAYVDRGRYHTQLTRYFRVYPAAQVHLIVFDDIITCPERVLESVFRFLGVDSRFSPDGVNRTVNSAIGEVESPPIDDRRWIADELSHEIVALSGQLNRDLTHWLD